MIMDNNFKVSDEILSNSYNSMNSIVGKIFRLSFDEIDEFEFPTDEEFGLQIIHNDTLYCLIVRFSSKNKNLICTGPGYHFRDEILPNGKYINLLFLIDGVGINISRNHLLHILIL